MSDTILFWREGKGHATTPKVVLFGFGKHPAWSEHEQKLGETSESLLRLRDRLYWNGIQKHAKTWEALPPESRCEFDHWLVWMQPESIVLGRIVAIKDHSGRKFAFIVVAEVAGCPRDLVLRRLAPELEEFVQRCCKLPNRKAVDAAFSSQQGALESLVVSAVPAAESLVPSPAERAAFANAPGWDSDGVALARLLYKVESSWAAFAPLRDGKAPKPQGGVALRVPAVPRQVVSSVLLWEEFVSAHVHPRIPRLYVVPATYDWLDLIVGEIEASHFIGLQTGCKHLGLETQVPHAVGPELQARAKTLMAAWRAGTPLPVRNGPPSGAGPSEPKTKSLPKQDTKTTPAADQPPSPAPVGAAPAKPGGRSKLPWMLGLAAVAAGAWWLIHPARFGADRPLAVRETVSARQPAIQPPIAPELADVAEPPLLEEGDNEKPMELMLKVRGDGVSLGKLKLEATVKPIGRVGVRSSFSEGRWQLLLTPQSSGAATLRVTATDERGLSSRAVSFAVKVNPKPVAPVLGEVKPVPALEEGSKEVVTELPVMVQTQLVSLAKVTIEPTVEPSGILSVRTNYSGDRWQLLLTPQQPGSAKVTVKVSDERGTNSQPVSFKVTVNPRPVPPVVEAPKAVPALAEGGKEVPIDLPVTVQTQLVLLAKVTIEIKVDPSEVVNARASYTGGRWQLALTPQKPGSAKVTVRATDERGLSGQGVSFEVTVAKAQRPVQPAREVSAAPSTAVGAVPPARAPGQNELDQLNSQLEAFRVWFNLGRKSDSKIKNPPAFPGQGEIARPLEGELSIPLRRFYREKAAELQTKLKAAKALTPELERTFKLLTERIDNWP
jgi:hypothetical protein